MFVILTLIASELYFFKKRSTISDHVKKCEKTIPKIIVLDGNIGAGKTTFLKALSRITNISIELEPVEEFLHPINLLELAYTDPYLSQKGFNDIMIRQMKTILSKHSGRDYIIMERGLYSCEMFTNVAYQRGKLTLSEKDALMQQIQDGYRAMNLPPIPSAFVYLDTAANQCIRNIRKRNRKGKERIDIDFLQLLEQEQRQHISKQANVLALKLSDMELFNHE